MDTPKLSLVKPDDTPELDNITEEDIKTLNVDKLRQAMLQGIYTIESCLFVQAGNEYNRIAKLRDIVSKLETNLFDEKTFTHLEPEEKIRLYTAVLQDKHRSLDFLQTLHSNVASGIDTLTQIEKLKVDSTKPKQTTTHKESTAVEEVKRMILQKIKEKTSVKPGK